MIHTVEIAPDILFSRIRDDLFEQIKHGDKEHQEWLKDKLFWYFENLKNNFRD